MSSASCVWSATMPLIANETVPYVMFFVALAVICFLVVLKQRQTEKVTVTAEFRTFQRMFVSVYLLCVMADWMQGPYVYALYEYYGFDVGAIGRLFIWGFGSSMIFGTFIGGAADRFGRRLNCIVFGILYSASCITKHFNDYNVLLVGRLLGGIATSILYSAFETWMIHEHKRQGFPEEWMPNTFAIMSFGNGLVAIVAGVVASFAAGTWGFVAPFDVSLALLIVATITILVKWVENYGDASASSGGFDNFGQAWRVLVSNEKVLLLGIIQSCFEGAMFIFVFIWTPALEGDLEEGQSIPHGLIFACFMVCIMIGSNVFSSVIKTHSVENSARFVMLLAAFALAVPVMFKNHRVNLVAFCVFEVCCGMYFPSLGTLRGRFIPEEVRATIMNVFRIGLNVIVVLVLANIEAMTQDAVFIMCSMLLCLACLAQHRLFALSTTNASAEERSRQGLDAGEEVDSMLHSKEDVAA